MESNPLMVHQPDVITKPKSPKVKHLLRNALAFLALVALINPAQAFIKMDSKAIDAAIVYGLKNQEANLSSLLGPNWVEGGNGELLTIYSPFMVLASKATKSGFPDSPTKTDLEKARDKLGKWVAFYRDEKNARKLEVKFVLSFYGKTPEFAHAYEAKIIGIGRGKEFEVKPARRYLDIKADPVPGEVSTYEALNSYYFRFNDLENMDEFRLILESPTGEPIVFRLNNGKLY